MGTTKIGFGLHYISTVQAVQLSCCECSYIKVKMLWASVAIHLQECPMGSTGIIILGSGERSHPELQQLDWYNRSALTWPKTWAKMTTVISYTEHNEKRLAMGSH